MSPTPPRLTIKEVEDRARWFLGTFVYGGTRPGSFASDDVTFVQSSDDEGFVQAVVNLPGGETYRVEVEAVQQ